MARPIAEGDYIIINGSNTLFALDSSTGVNNANVFLWRTYGGTPQVFQVSYGADDSMRIMTKFGGKSIDVVNARIVDGTNIQMYTYNGSERAQLWIPSVTGQNVSYNGETYPSYKLSLKANTSFVIGIDGTAAAGTNVVLKTSGSGLGQTWIFVKPKPITSGNVYEIHSAYSDQFVIGISSSSKSNGAKVSVLPQNATNSQVFSLVEEYTNRWRAMNMNSGLYLDMKGGTAQLGVMLDQWEDSSSSDIRRQQWNVAQIGTQEYRGDECAIVTFGAYGGELGDTLFMHADNMTDTGSSDVYLSDDSEDLGSQWVLVPSEVKNPSIPVPYVKGINNPFGEERGVTSQYHVMGDTYYLCWQGTSTWNLDSANHYDYRYRQRYMRSSDSLWESWEPWTGWITSSYTVLNRYCWDATPYDGSYDISEYKNLCVEFQVRGVAANGEGDTGSVEVGDAGSSGLIYIYWEPTFSFPSTGISSEGLRIGYSNDYPYGTSTVTVQRLLDRNGKNLLVGQTELDKFITFSGLGSDGSILIPASHLVRPIENNEQLTLRYALSTDQSDWRAYPHTSTITATEDAGSGDYAVPQLEVGAGRTLVVTLEHIGEEHLWVRLDDGRSFEVEGHVVDGDTVFMTPYPFNHDFTLYTTATSSDGSMWGTESTFVSKNNPLLRRYQPCHAWNWDGGSFLLEANSNEVFRTDRTLKPTYIANTLNSRDRQSVTFAKTVSGEFRAVGILYENVTESTVEQLVELVDKHHVMYRAPSGEMADVAITGVTYTRQPKVVFVEVTMIEETV